MYYTKKDKGGKLYLPQYGDKPCLVMSVETEDEIVTIRTPDGESMEFFLDGKESEYHELPILSRTPYIQGEPFVCVVERPEPVTDWYSHEMHCAILKIMKYWDGSLNDYDLTTKICEFILSGCKCKNSTGQTQFMCCNICGQIDAKVDKELSEDKRKERTAPYPNMQASGKIKVDTPEQSEAVQRVLFGMGYRWVINPNDQEAKHTDKPILAWRNQTITFASDADWNCIGLGGHIHHLTDFGIEQEPKPFGPEDAAKTIYDQEGNEYWYIDSVNGPFAQLANDSQIIRINPDGTTATALKFTRKKPNQ